MIRDGVVLSELKAGSMFGEISFVGMCKKVMRRIYGNSQIERTCSIEAMDLTRTVEISVQDLFLSLQFDSSGEDAVMR